MDYRNKLILAPMVRVSTLPFRLLALEYGADLVYCEEIIDYKIMNCKRIYNEVLDTIDFCIEGIPKPVFRTKSIEKDRIVFQLGTANAERAVKACKLIENDVAAIDLNMGCPKEFSIQGGMGAALLKKPEKIKELVTALVRNCKKPITCKIRCLYSIDDTIELCKLIESCGASAITVHGRFQDERPRHPNHNDYIKEITKHIKIPIIANGGSNVIKKYEDIETFKTDCGVTSVMIARAVMWNCSLFRKEGLLPIDDVIKRYLQICMDTDNFFFNTKYALQQMMHEQLETERGVKLLGSQVAEEIYFLFDMLDVYKLWRNDYDKKLNEHLLKHFKDSEIDEIIKKRLEEREKADDETSSKKMKLTAENIDDNFDDLASKVICLPLKFVKKDFEDVTVSPKSILHAYSYDRKLPKPVYKTEEKKPERIYKSLLEFNGYFYTSPFWEPNKQVTEQSAAMVCLQTIGVDYKSIKALKKHMFKIL